MLANDSSHARASRTDTEDSEDTAMSNGRKTLAEVAAKLNDVDGAERAGGSVVGGKGLISVDRIPFLANLFNYRTYNNGGIVVDEEDANQEDNPIADIFLWRFPLVSMIWFCILQVVFFLCVFCDYSLLTIAAFLGLWQLIVDLILSRAVPSAQKAGFVPDDIEINEVIKKNTFFNPKFIKRIASASHELADIAIGLWKVTVFEANMSRVLVVGRFLFVVFLRSFSVATTAYLFIMVLFTIPVSYSKNQVFADAVADGAHVAATRRFRRLRALCKNITEIVETRARIEAENVEKGPASSRPARAMSAATWGVLLGAVNKLNWVISKLIG